VCWIRVRADVGRLWGCKGLRVTPASASRVIVAYATRSGSTRGVAEQIAERLRATGLDVDSIPAERVAGAEFDALVLGSAVFDQRWMPAAVQLVHDIAPALQGRPVWLFSVGMLGDDRRVFGSLVRREPKDIAELRGLVRARDYRVFAGAIAREQWPPVSRLFARALGVRIGDNRNWPAIEAWADGIARELNRGGRRVGEQARDT
jgi:menaquinone-dependent protoporphyrinogen oxidase